jgi:regulatory protein
LNTETSQPLEPERLEQVELCYQQGVKLLVAREHSIRELSRKLTKRGYEDEVIALAIDSMVADGSLDETRYCEAYIYQRYNRGYGPSRISQELHERGVDRLVVQQMINDPELDWFSSAQQVYTKRFGSDKAGLERKQIAKQQRFLRYRGFSHEQISEAMRPTDTTSI